MVRTTEKVHNKVKANLCHREVGEVVRAIRAETLSRHDVIDRFEEKVNTATVVEKEEDT
jgi:hypothetical protein